MSIIKLPLRYEGSQGDKIINTLFDSGANLSCIHSDQVEELAILVKLFKPRKVSISTYKDNVEAEHAIALDFYIDDVRLSDEFMVIPKLDEDVIIGAATMRKWRIKLDFENNKVIVDPKVAKLQLI